MKESTLRKKMEAIRKASINVTSDVLSSGARLKSAYIKSRADDETKAIKRARAYDDAPNYDDKGMPTDAYKARFMADIIKEDIEKRNKKRLSKMKNVITKPIMKKVITKPTRKTRRNK